MRSDPGARPVEGRPALASGATCGYAARSSSATACAASPSPRPVKPRKSVVVARTLTRPTSTPSAPASRLAHRLPVRRDPWLLPDQDAVGVDELEARLAHVPVGLGEQLERVGAAVALVVGRERARRCRQAPRLRGARRSARARSRRRRSGPRARAGARSTTPPRTSGTPSANACASTPMPIRRSLIGARLARPAATRGRRDRTWPPAASAAACPTAHGERGPRRAPRRQPEARRCRLGHRRTRPRRRHSPRARRRARRSAGSGLRTPRLADDEMTSAGSVGVARPPLERRGLVADDPDAQPELADGLEAGDRVGVEIVAVVLEAVPPGRRPLDPEVPPELVVLLAALDRDAERRPDDVRLQPLPLGEHPPPPLLVDERLADVEEDRLQSHDSTSARSASVVIFSSRTSPSTTRIRPPRASTREAQSVAASGSSPAIGGTQGGRSERLRCLHGDEIRAVDGLDDEASLDPLDRVGEREPRHDAVIALPERQRCTRSITSSSTSGRAASWTMHDERVVGNLARAQHEPIRPGSRRPLTTAATFEATSSSASSDRRVLPVGRNGNDDGVDPVARVEPFEALGEQARGRRARRTPSAVRRRVAHPSRPRRESPRSQRLFLRHYSPRLRAPVMPRSDVASRARGGDLGLRLDLLLRHRRDWRAPRRATRQPRPRSCSWRT